MVSHIMCKAPSPLVRFTKISALASVAGGAPWSSMSLHSVRKLAKFVGTTGPLLARHQSPADQAKLHEYGRRLRNKTPTLSEFDVNPENSRQRASLRTSLTSNYHPDLAWGLPDCMRELIQNLVDCWFKEARHALGITRPVFTNKQEGSVHFLLVGDLDKPARTPVAVGAVELRKQDNTILIHQVMGMPTVGHGLHGLHGLRM